jgi:hypothetical protein
MCCAPRQNHSEVLDGVRNRIDSFGAGFLRASGEGPKCKGLRNLVEYADSHVALMQVRFDDFKLEQLANGGLVHAAKDFALVPSLSRSR